MQIFVMRHGQAETVAPSDKLRPLTENGLIEARTSALWFAENQHMFDCILVSPYLRAQQTADTVIEQLKSLAVRETISFITPEDNAKEVHDYLDALLSLKQYKKILLVSHMPLVSYLVAELTCDNTMPIFQTASIAQVEYDTKRMLGEFIRLVSPNEIAS